MGKLKVGIDNYSLNELNLTPLECLEYAHEHDLGGVSFSGLYPDAKKLIYSDYLRDMREYAAQNNIYIEWGGAQHIPRDMNNWTAKDIFQDNQAVAIEAEALGVRIVRSCSGGLMRWYDSSPSTETLLRETAQTLLAQRSMLREHNVILAIETHFEFTTFELRRLLEMCEAEPGDWLGICLDTMNLLTMLEDPALASERILPWVVSTHIKDGGIILDPKGIRTFTTPVGSGVVDFKRIFSLLKMLDREIGLNIEDHGGDFLLPVFDPLFLSKFPDLSVQEFARLLELAHDSASKIAEGKIAILPRENWAEQCEKRLIGDENNLRTMLNGLYC